MCLIIALRTHNELALELGQLPLSSFNNVRQLSHPLATLIVRHHQFLPPLLKRLSLIVIAISWYVTVINDAVLEVLRLVVSAVSHPGRVL